MKARQFILFILMIVGEMIAAVFYPYQRSSKTLVHQSPLPKSAESSNDYNMPVQIRQTRLVCLFYDLCASSIAQAIRIFLGSSKYNPKPPIYIIQITPRPCDPYYEHCSNKG
ncbi:uncharacterized protein LOC123296500 [Chrysoperla carnea]|uniref:uncharacterized protein LOC123296500 n=1 Tax=Chrysoperla carnea TaxID=189513 RepID=UPI001D0900A2|nr:uncharacterized protein LOC123296500 [Chrysoperla carnea]